MAEITVDGWHCIRENRFLGFDSYAVRVEPGYTFNIDGHIELCSMGLHASRNLGDAVACALEVGVFGPNSDLPHLFPDKQEVQCGGWICRIKLSGGLITNASIDGFDPAHFSYQYSSAWKPLGFGPNYQKMVGRKREVLWMIPLEEFFKEFNFPNLYHNIYSNSGWREHNQRCNDTAMRVRKKLMKRKGNIGKWARG